jgi:hypothetical protein
MGMEAIYQGSCKFTEKSTRMNGRPKIPCWFLFLLMIATTQCKAKPWHQPRPNAPRNQFLNGSFEEGTDPWFALTTHHWESFSISVQHARKGHYSAHLGLRAGSDAEGTKIVGVIQELRPTEFPRRLSGYYRIEGWKRGAPKQYLQAVVIVIGDPSARPYPNYQLRYVLTGVDKPPLTIVNARYRIPDKSGLQEGIWVRFDFNLCADFQRQWGRIPSEFSRIRVLFEVRYDEKKAGGNEARADVYYDELYIGD